MSGEKVRFDNVAYQMGANAVQTNAQAVNKANNAVATGNAVKYRSDWERMLALQGRKGMQHQQRNHLFCRFYSLADTVPSPEGPGSLFWEEEVGTAGPQIINFPAIQESIFGKTTLVAMVAKGYVYSEGASEIQFKTYSDDGIRIIFNNETVIDNWTSHGPTEDTSSYVTLPRGYTPIKILFFQGGASGVLQLSYRIGADETWKTSGNGVFFYTDDSTE